MKTRIFHEGESLFDFIEEHVDFCHSCECRNRDFITSTEGQVPEKETPLGGEKEEQIPPSSEGQKQILEEGDILVITSKIVALSEGRTFEAGDENKKIEYIARESLWHKRTKYVHLSLKDGIPMASAGIDESNGDGRCIMLPKNSYESAYRIWHSIKEKYSFANFGVIITDSHTVPFRKGTTGISLGHMGFHGVKSYVGKPDIFGRLLAFSKVNIVDALATSAVHTMGEGDECQPLAIIKNPHVTYTEERQNGDDLIIDIQDDMYSPLFR